ncbi:hypothetical protein LPJ53_005230 [Coemansia erecta]|uniref:LIM zinc-binding domain-containing protein n=1 Tax=Coemansia erecta TaxID=147472 RepID=A0A9W7XSV6_9FUNG|nr:hypothetical protein LPJ53_005230 [Coemansia erecta]
MAGRSGRVSGVDSQQARGSPFKYDIRVTGDLFGDRRDNATTTKVSVKILGNEDGDIVVEQEDSATLASPTPSIDGEPRKPEFTSKRASDGGLELHIRALPSRSKAATPAALETIAGGGGGSSSDCEASSVKSNSLTESGNIEDIVRQTKTPSSMISAPTTRASTRMSEYTQVRSESSGQSLHELRPAFEDEGPISPRDLGARTPQSMEMPAAAVLVGGGGISGSPPKEHSESEALRPRSASMVVTTEDKCTMTTWRGIPGDVRPSVSRQTDAPIVADDSDYHSDSGVQSPALSVLRGGGAARRDVNSVLSAFNGPPVAPPESRASSRASARPRSLPREVNKYKQLPPRRSAKDKVNYREVAENLLTQYFAEEVLHRYLDELRRQYRFMGNGGMTSSEITKLLDETTADSQLKEQLRASLEELVKAPMPEANSDYEPTVSSSQRHYLSVRGTELRNVLDRTSVSPAPNSVRSKAPSSILVGGGNSMENLPSPGGRGYNTIRSDQMSVAATVLPAESLRDGLAESARGSPRLKPQVKTAPTPAPPSRISSPAPEPKTERALSAASSIQSIKERVSTPPASEPRKQNAQRPPPSQSDKAQSGASEEPKLDPKYWDDDDKYRMHPPDMNQAFTVLKSKPIFVREMSSSDIKFSSPFSKPQHTTAGASQSQKPTSSRSPPKPAAASEAKDAFAERHPTESKVAKAVSELEEVLRRTEAETLASIESDFNGSSHSGDTESVLSRDSLVGGGASSRSASVATRISAVGSKYVDTPRPDSVSKLSASQSTIRTEILLKEGLEFEAASGDENEEEAVVPVEREPLTESTVSLPMNIEDMPAELAAVLMRTGGVENARIRRTSTPSSVLSSVRSSLSSAARASQPSQLSAKPAAPPSRATVKDTAPSRASARSTAAESQVAAGTQKSSASSAAARSLTELDIVMKRTAAVLSRASASSRATSVASAASSLASGVLRGGSGAPNSPGSARDLDNELANVLRRTSGYAPSLSSYSPSAASNSRPVSVVGEVLSVATPEPVRPASQRTAFSRAPSANPREQPRSPILRAVRSPVSQSPAPSASAAANKYAASPLRNTGYQGPKSPRATPVPPAGPSSVRSQQQPQPQPQRPTQQQQQQQDNQSERGPSPVMPYIPTPVFGRFPSPPPYIKNRGKEEHQDEEDDGAASSGPAASAPQSNPPPSMQRGSSRGRAQSQSAQPMSERVASRQYEEEPVIERLDLETGSLASRHNSRGRPQAGSEFGSASTLMNLKAYDLPKVVEEDVDSLASYPSSHRAPSVNLVGGGAGGSSSRSAQKEPEPSTLRGGGGLPMKRGGKEACEAGCCGVCGQGVSTGDVVVRPQVMHASCLRCEACDCLLTSSTFRAIDGHVYCEADYHRFFSRHQPQKQKQGNGQHAALAVRPGMSEKQFQEMNRAIMESFTSVDDFLMHMRQLRQASGDQTGTEVDLPYSGDRSKVQRAGDMGVDRQTHYEREQVTSPQGTPWITERVVDKKVKTKVLEKRYPASAATPSGTRGNASEMPTETTLVGGGAGLPRAAANASRASNSALSRPATSLLNDTKLVNGWEHPLCPSCNHVVYLNDRVTHEGYGYHKACMRCRQCSQVIPATSAIRIKGALYCKKHGTELLRRRSILMRKKSTMGRRSRNQKPRAGIMPAEGFGKSSPAADAENRPPPVPAMPMFSGADDGGLPLPQRAPGGGSPRRVTTALRNFLEAAAEQVENQSFLPIPSSNPPSARSNTGSTARSPEPVVVAPKPRRPLPQPKPKSAPPPASSPASPRPNSRSIFAGSPQLYDPNVVNALRQEAQRQINGSQSSIVSPVEMTRRLLSPCGPSIADALQKLGGRDGRVSVSSQFDPFVEASQDPLNNVPMSPRHKPQSGAPFAANEQIDNLERRFRNANFRPPWALKSQTMLNQG